MQSTHPEAYWVSEVVLRGPFPNAKQNSLSLALNLVFLSSIIPAIGYLYVKIRQVKIVSSYSFDAIIIGIVLFFLAYSSTMVFVSGKIPKSLFAMRSVIDYEDKRFRTFVETALRFMFNPPKWLLVLLLVLNVAGEYSVIKSDLLYQEDLFVLFLIFLLLCLSSFLNWIGAWALYSFLRICSKLGKEISLRINPFHPDRVGGMSSIADLTTMALLVISMLAAFSVPLWYIFSPYIAIGLVIIASAVIPCFFCFSMLGIYHSLKEEKNRTLKELGDELFLMSLQVKKYVFDRHEKRLKEKELMKLSNTLSALEKIYSSTKKMRTFPLNSEMLIKLVSIILLPVVSLAMSRVAEFLFTLLG